MDNVSKLVISNPWPCQKKTRVESNGILKYVKKYDFGYIGEKPANDRT